MVLALSMAMVIGPTPPGTGVMARQPLIYRRKEGGTFLLYGVGKNRTDDGGAVDPKPNAGGQRDDIWLYAPPAR